MIKKVFYTDKRTYIQDDKYNEVTSDYFTFAEALSIARTTKAEFDYDNISRDDIEAMNSYLMTYHKGIKNRDTIKFIQKCNANNIKDIIGRQLNICDIEAIFSLILNEYNSDTELYNMEAYGTDTYIASYMCKILKQSAIDTDNVVNREALLIISKTLNTDDYSLDTFLSKLETIKQEAKDTALLKSLKNDFNREYNCSAEAIENYIGILVTFGGDYSGRIAQAMNKCFDDIIEGKPFCDRKGLIEAIKNNDIGGY